eukprot:FR738937.1.p1 GENE.FR738937.1~~FR738937.1.p1  ORF type:complete len:191 (+),score=25.67 FR738937.1:120-692(+)
MNIMDYSMLVGVHDGDELDEEGHRFSSVRLSLDQNDWDNLEDDMVSSETDALESEPNVSSNRKASGSSSTAAAAEPSMTSINEGCGVYEGDGDGDEGPKVGLEFQSQLDPLRPNNSPFRLVQGGIQAEENGKQLQETYLFGIIDILQTYNQRKKVETFFKSFKNKKQEISCVDPGLYGNRFYDFMAAATH